MLILIVVMLTCFMATVAFSVDIAYMHLSRTELRTATDAAAKAASVELTRSLDMEQATAKGREIAAQNRVAGAPLQLADDDFTFGRSDQDSSGKFQFTSGQTPLNTVRVNGRRTTESVSGAIPLLFGNVMGIDTFEPEAIAAATYIERDVVLVVDRSGSMSGQKFQDLQDAIRVFTDTLATTPVAEHVGLASYSSSASEDAKLTKQLNAISSAMSSMSVGGMTSISGGMQAGAAIMEHGRSEKFVERTMIVMTDGLHNTGPEPSGIASTLAADNVRIHTVTFGSGADQDRMRQIASIGGGKHFHALSAAELADAYREIALTLGTVITE
jgi:Mg-chelatase subunit ChlD